MAAIVLDAAPSIETTAHGDANAQLYTIPPGTNRLTVLVEALAGAMSFSGTDGGALGANQFPLVADVPFTIRISSGTSRETGRELYVAAAAAATVDVVCERD